MDTKTPVKFDIEEMDSEEHKGLLVISAHYNTSPSNAMMNLIRAISKNDGNNQDHNTENDHPKEAV